MTATSPDQEWKKGSALSTDQESALPAGTLGKPRRANGGLA
jgi:hypothetical protein